MPLFTDIRDFFGGLDNVSDEQLGIYVSDAEDEVKADGVPETHAKFSKLLRYKLGALLVAGPGTGQLQGLGASSGTAIKKKEVGDVKIEFKDQGIDTTGGGIIKDLPGGGYAATYLKNLRDVVGLTHMISG